VSNIASLFPAAGLKAKYSVSPPGGMSLLMKIYFSNDAYYEVIELYSAIFD
jgi:hypothetical protein